MRRQRHRRLLRAGARPQGRTQVLNEEPRPDDLPDAPTGYAALPPSYPPPSHPRPSSSPAPAGPGGPGATRSWLRPALAAVAVVAVVAVVVLAVWRIGNPPPVAQPQPRT